MAPGNQITNLKSRFPLSTLRLRNHRSVTRALTIRRLFYFFVHNKPLERRYRLNNQFAEIFKKKKEKKRLKKILSEVRLKKRLCLVF